MRAGAVALAVGAVAAVSASGCGGTGHDETAAGSTTGSTTARAASGKVAGRLPPGAVGPTDTAEEAAEGPAATEASPEAPAAGPGARGELPSGESSALASVVHEYVAGLDHHEAGRVCALLEQGALNLGELPKRRGGCRASLRASIATSPRGGGPAWRRTSVVELKPENLGDSRARVTATVVHHFSDRKYVSVEDDVIYLERVDGRWLIAKPSATLYRAVGYAQPPLRAFSPPQGW